MLRWTMSTVCVVLLCAGMTWAAEKVDAFQGETDRHLDENGG